MKKQNKEIRKIIKMLNTPAEDEYYVVSQIQKTNRLLGAILNFLLTYHLPKTKLTKEELNWIKNL